MPRKKQKNIANNTVEEINPAKLEWLYTTMYKIRRFEETMLEQTFKGNAMGVTHPSDGQEAVPVGICAHLTDKDWIGSAHRGHGHCIAKGLEINRMMAEIMGLVYESLFCVSSSSVAESSSDSSVSVASVASGVSITSGSVDSGAAVASDASGAAFFFGVRFGFSGYSRTHFFF